ncbi:MAG: glycoside hydrolase family 47 protein, partial [Bacteroidota bacterium]
PIYLFFLLAFAGFLACTPTENHQNHLTEVEETPLGQELIDETQRTWQAYKQYAWGSDVLKPLSRGAQNWYEEPLYISPIDAYSTLFVMGLLDEAQEIENYVVDSLDFDKDIDAKVFEVNIRILGGLLSMYELSQNRKVLDKAQDFADRMLPAFDTPTGIPSYWVNLKTGAIRGDTINLAEAATYTMEMGILSYYTQEPKYYQAGKKATLAVFNKRSALDLLSDGYDVMTGDLVWRNSHICAGADSYYEYLYKSYKLFGDEELGDIWRTSIAAVQKYIPEYHDERLWYGRVNMDTGEHNSSVVTLYDAFMPAILAISGYQKEAVELQHTFDWLWTKYDLEPMIYDYKKGTPNYPVYDLNPEIMESAYYLWNVTGDSIFYQMNVQYWSDIKEFCRTDVAFTAVEDVESKEKRDYMPTFFFAETLKYLYLTFAHPDHPYAFNELAFNTEAHPFFVRNFDQAKAKEYLGFD